MTRKEQLEQEGGKAYRCGQSPCACKYQGEDRKAWLQGYNNTKAFWETDLPINIGAAQ